METVTLGRDAVVAWLWLPVPDLRVASSNLVSDSSLVMKHRFGIVQSCRTRPLGQDYVVVDIIADRKMKYCSILSFFSVSSRLVFE